VILFQTWNKKGREPSSCNWTACFVFWMSWWDVYYLLLTM
jgi:hypothetical protein